MDIKQKATLFADNVRAFQKDFIWHGNPAKRLAALVYTVEGKTVDTEVIKASHKLLKDNVGAFSTFRGNLAIYIASALSLAKEPSILLPEVLRVYDLLKAEGFWASDYLVATAFEIAANTPPQDHVNMAQRTKTFYDEMKANHRFRIGQGDYIFAAMLAMSQLDPHEGAVKMKRLFQRIKAEFSAFISRNSQLTLAQMMTLGGSTEDCVTNLAHLNRTLRQQKIRLDKTYTLPSLGVLGLLNVNHHTIANEITDMTNFLRAQKGFGYFSITTHELLMYVVALIGSCHIEDDNITRASLTTSITNLIIAQQVAIISGIAVASASSSC